MAWILCKDSENKVFYENPDSGEMTRKQPKEFIGNEERCLLLKEDLKLKRLRLKKELAELDTQIALQSNSSFEETPVVLKKPASESKELIEAEEKQHLEEYQRITNEIDGLKKGLTITDKNIKEAQETINEEKSKHIQIEHDIEKLYEQLKSLDALWKPNGRIEEQPAEILVHILKQMFDLKSITKCFNTNSRWRKIVEETFKNTGKVACLFMFLKNYVTKPNKFLIIFSKSDHSRGQR